MAATASSKVASQAGPNPDPDESHAHAEIFPGDAPAPGLPDDSPVDPSRPPGLPPLPPRIKPPLSVPPSLNIPEKPPEAVGATCTHTPPIQAWPPGQFTSLHPSWQAPFTHTVAGGLHAILSHPLSTHRCVVVEQV